MASPGHEVHKYAKGNAGFQDIFSRTAKNKEHTAGGTAIVRAKYPVKSNGVCKYYFWFGVKEDKKLSIKAEPGHVDLVFALYHLFNQDKSLVKEFFKKDGRLSQDKKTRLAHKFAINEDEMDSDSNGMETDAKPDSNEEDDYDVDDYFQDSSVASSF